MPKLTEKAKAAYNVAADAEVNRMMKAMADANIPMSAVASDADVNRMMKAMGCRPECLDRLYRKREGSDGQDCEVRVTRMPAEFFRIVAHASTNSIGWPVPPFALMTGSGMHDLAHAIAKAVSEGMLGLGRIALPQKED